MLRCGPFENKRGGQIFNLEKIIKEKGSNKRFYNLLKIKDLTSLLRRRESRATVIPAEAGIQVDKKGAVYFYE